MRFIKASLLLVLAACPDRPIASVYPEQGSVEQKDLPAVEERNVDILFLVDNSLSMEAEQTSLRANFPRFMNILETIEGGAPNMHIGVVTSNLGQSASDGVGTTTSFGSSCASKGDDGAMRTAPVVSGRFIVDEESGGTRNRNYTGTLADAFSAIANVGIDGCGIEQHLGAVKRALENQTNTGFLRPDAKLAVIVIADEDDCSLSHKALFEGSTDGTVVNFRCTQSGVECDGDPTLSIPGEHANCRPKDPSPFLNSVDTYVDYLRSLKANPDKDVIVGGILGDPDKFKITTDKLLGPACMYGDQSAFPAVRTASFLQGFPLSVEGSICGADLQKPLVDIAKLLRGSWGDPCFDSKIMDIDPNTDGLQADCTLTDMRGDDELAVIPNCSFNRIPCWRIEIDEEHCGFTPAHQKLVIDRGGVLPASDIHVKVNCVTEQDAGQVQ
jgi:hypothetical protein